MLMDKMMIIPPLAPLNCPAKNVPVNNYVKN